MVIQTRSKTNNIKKKTTDKKEENSLEESDTNSNKTSTKKHSKPVSKIPKSTWLMNLKPLASASNNSKAADNKKKTTEKITKPKLAYNLEGAYDTVRKTATTNNNTSINNSVSSNKNETKIKRAKSFLKYLTPSSEKIKSYNINKSEVAKKEETNTKIELENTALKEKIESMLEEKQQLTEEINQIKNTNKKLEENFNEINIQMEKRIIENRKETETRLELEAKLNRKKIKEEELMTKVEKMNIKESNEEFYEKEIERLIKESKDYLTENGNLKNKKERSETDNRDLRKQIQSLKEELSAKENTIKEAELNYQGLLSCSGEEISSLKKHIKELLANNQRLKVVISHLSATDFAASTSPLDSDQENKHHSLLLTHSPKPNAHCYSHSYSSNLIPTLNEPQPDNEGSPQNSTKAELVPNEEESSALDQRLAQLLKTKEKIEKEYKKIPTINRNNYLVLEKKDRLEEKLIELDSQISFVKAKIRNIS